MKKIILVLCFFMMSSVYAASPITQYRHATLHPAWESSGQAVCGVITAWTSEGLTFYANKPSTSYVNACFQGEVWRVTLTTRPWCANGTAPNTTLPTAQQCGDPEPTCTPGAVTKSTFKRGTGPLGAEVPTSPSLPFPTSNGSCNVDYTVDECYAVPNGSGSADFFCDYTGPITGSTPAGSSNPAPSSPSLDAPKTPTDVPPFNPAQGQGCPAGTVNLGIDSTGGSICGGSGASPSTPTKTETKASTPTTTNPDGSTTKTETTTRTNTDGSTTTTTKTTTTGADGKVTTTQGSVTGAKPSTSGGGSGKDDSSDEKKDDFCLKNPSLNICKNSEVNGGGCSAGSDTTSCTGDAIQCAILRQQKKEYCENTKESAIGTLGNQLLAGNDPMKEQIDAAKLGTPFDLGSQSFDQSSFAPSACFGTKSGSVNGHAISIDFSRACSSATNIRLAVIALCSLVGFLIVARSISQV